MAKQPEKMRVRIIRPTIAIVGGKKIDLAPPKAEKGKKPKDETHELPYSVGAALVHAGKAVDVDASPGAGHTTESAGALVDG